MTTAPEDQEFRIRSSSFMRWTRNVLFLAGALAICFVALTMWRAKRYQQQANITLDAQMPAAQQKPAQSTAMPPAEGDAVGRIEIPRLRMKIAILEGTAVKTLQLGVGHIQGTPLPGEAGNVGLAGHRDTYFRGLKDIRVNDRIQVQTAAELSTYVVDSIRIVSPSDVGVLAPSAKSSVTLVTCYPFYFIGAAPKRFIVHAQRIELN